MIKPIKATLRNVEIEVNSRCNRRCSYCPVSLNPKPKVPRLMDKALFNRILQQLLEINYDGRISYHFYGEPLLRNDLEDFISETKRILPRAHQVLFSNGDLMTEERYKSLMLAGVHYIVITSHSGKVHPERPRQIVQYSQDLVLTNRGGILQHLPEASEKEQCKPCYVPDEMVVLTVDGEVLPCYEDSQRQHSFGNITKNTLEEIWLHPRYIELRNRLSAGNRKDGMSICRACTNVAHAKPGTSARSEPFWAEIKPEF